MSGQYTVYHLHSDLSNGVTNIDSVTKYGEYIAKAKECGMNAMGFSEHGSVFEWWHKKSAIEAAGMKYIHAVECYLTTTLTEKIRDNYHCVLLAKNYSGFLELNRLVSNSFCRKDNHFYYAPRITFDELFHTSDNILVTTACVGGVLGKGDEQVQRVYLDFLTRNRHRCFLEVGHHMDEKQISYNKKLLALSQELTIPLIAGTDTHVLLRDLDEKTSINSRQLDILIKLDFFSDFGNQRELLRITSLFSEMFKKGQAKQIRKSDVDGTPLEEIVKRYAVGVTKSGGIAKSYTLLDVASILREAETVIKAAGMDDLSDLIKVRNFYDVMGYIGYVSGNEADRRKLYITDIKPLYRKRDNKQFGYSLFTKSIGSGKESRFTVFNRVFDKEPVKEGDIIYCKGYERDGEYYTLTAYQQVF